MRARAGGFRSIVASLDGGNLASRRLHDRFGFVERGRLPAIIHKFDRWLDVVYLQLELGEDSRSG